MNGKIEHFIVHNCRLLDLFPSKVFRNTNMNLIRLGQFELLVKLYAMIINAGGHMFVLGQTENKIKYGTYYMATLNAFNPALSARIAWM